MKAFAYNIVSSLKIIAVRKCKLKMYTSIKQRVLIVRNIAIIATKTIEDVTDKVNEADIWIIWKHS